MQLNRSGRTYMALRKLRNRVTAIHLGIKHIPASTSVHRSAKVSRDLCVGEYVYIGPECQVGPATTIGSYTMLGPRVAVVGDDHVWDMIGVPSQFAGRPTQRATKIGTDAWIGYGSTIMRGCTIGDGSIVAAGSVVTKDIPRNQIWGGNPARHIRDRFSESDALVHYDKLRNREFLTTFAQPPRGTNEQ